MAVLHPLSHEVDMDEQNAPRPTAVPRGVSEGTHQRPGRKHMGIATSDPTYLPPVDNPRAPASNRATHIPRRKASLGKGGSAQASGGTARTGGYIPPSTPTLQVRGRGGEQGLGQPSSYISQPKIGRSIFVSRHDRARKRVQLLLLILILAAIALALFWFFVLR